MHLNNHWSKELPLNDTIERYRGFNWINAIIRPLTETVTDWEYYWEYCALSVLMFWTPITVTKLNNSFYSSSDSVHYSRARKWFIAGGDPVEYDLSMRTGIFSIDIKSVQELFCLLARWRQGIPSIPNPLYSFLMLFSIEIDYLNLRLECYWLVIDGKTYLF